MPSAPIRDISIYYEECGGGPPLVLIMGTGGHSGGWALQVPTLSQHFRVITFDNRGAGRTSAPDRPYSIAAMAEDTAALMDHLAIQKAHVLGFSMGGLIAQELALAHPDRVDRMILVGSAARYDGYSRSLIAGLRDIRRSNLSQEQFTRLMATFLYSASLFENGPRYEQAIRNALSDPYVQLDHAFIRQCDAALAFDSRDRLANLKQPVLVLHGSEDTMVRGAAAEELGKLLPNATVRVLSGGHAGIVEFAAEYNAAILEFLGAGPKPPPGAAG